jgi:hypothetical protein
MKMTEASIAFAQDGTIPELINFAPLRIIPSIGIAARPGAGLSSLMV